MPGAPASIKRCLFREFALNHQLNEPLTVHWPLKDFHGETKTAYFLIVLIL